MERITQYDRLELVKRYSSHYYIRFEGGMFENIMCELPITDSEALSIMKNSSNIKTILEFYKKKVNWTKDYFVDTAILEYMKYKANYSITRQSIGMNKLDSQPEIKNEFYYSLINDKFPTESALEIEGYTAEKLYREFKLSILGAYNYLIWLKTEPQDALKQLNDGLKRK